MIVNVISDAIAIADTAVAAERKPLSGGTFMNTSSWRKRFDRHRTATASGRAIGRSIHFFCAKAPAMKALGRQGLRKPVQAAGFCGLEHLEHLRPSEVRRDVRNGQGGDGRRTQPDGVAQTISAVDSYQRIVGDLGGLSPVAVPRQMAPRESAASKETMKKSMLVAAALFVVAGANQAKAQCVSVGLFVGCPPPVWVAPQPVVFVSPPVYVAPPPVYVAPPPVYVAPPPVWVAGPSVLFMPPPPPPRMCGWRMGPPSHRGFHHR